MPKNKKPAGGRPAKNFDPSYAKGGSKGGPARAGSSKPGSRSAGHRGYRPEEAEAPRKARWSSEERVASGRSPHRADRAREPRRPRSPRARDEASEAHAASTAMTAPPARSTAATAARPLVRP